MKEASVFPKSLLIIFFKLFTYSTHFRTKMDLDLYYEIPEEPSFPTDIEEIHELQTFSNPEVPQYYEMKLPSSPANLEGIEEELQTLFNSEVPQTRTPTPAVAVGVLQDQEDNINNFVKILFRDVNNTAHPISPANDIAEAPAVTPVNPAAPANDNQELLAVSPVNPAAPANDDNQELPAVTPGRYKCPCLNCVQRTGVKDQHPCPQCDKIFKKKDKLRGHLDAKNGIKRHSCNSCGKTFSRSDMLARHVKTHNTGLRSLKCAQCKFSTDRKYQMANHVKIHGRYEKKLTGKRGRPRKNYV